MIILSCSVHWSHKLANLISIGDICLPFVKLNFLRLIKLTLNFIDQHNELPTKRNISSFLSDGIHLRGYG